MPTLDTFKRGSSWQILLIAPSKTGKTWGAGTWPRPCFMDFDGGLATLTSPEFRSAHPGVDLKTIEYETFIERDKTTGGVVKVPNAYDDACRYFDRKMAAGMRDSFDTWVIDSGTALSMAAMNKATYLLGNPAFAGPKGLSKTHASAIQHGLMIPKMQDFGAERSLVEQFIDMIRDSNKHVLLLCHEKEIWSGQGDAEKLDYYAPLLTGQSVERVPLRFDEVWWLRIAPAGEKGYRRYLQTHADGLHRCGTRTGVPDGTEWSYSAMQPITPKVKET